MKTEQNIWKSLSSKKIYMANKQKFSISLAIKDMQINIKCNTSTQWNIIH